MIAVLIVGDQSEKRSAVRRAILDLTNYDADVTMAGNVTDAIALLGSIRFDVTISDFRLGEGDVRQVLDFLRREQVRGLDRLVLFTAHGDAARAAHDKVIDDAEATSLARRIRELLGDVVPELNRW